MRVDTIVHSLISTTYSSNMSSKRVTANEGVNTDLQNASDPHLNKKQNEETVLKEGEFFHPPKHYVFPKTRIADRDRSCQQHWFKDFPWLHYDERYIFFLIESTNIKYIYSQLSN